MRKGILIAVGSMAALGAGYSIYAQVRQGNRDKLASALIREIKKVIDPSSTGLQAENAFDIHYQKEILKRISGQVYMLSPSAANQVAKEIENSFGAWWQGGDDEDKLYGIFRKLKDKVQVSQVAAAYYQLYKINLIDKLYNKLTKKEVGNILDSVKRLPAYRKAI